MSSEAPSAETIFACAIEIHTPDDRAAYLDVACADDPALRAEVEKLVQDHFRAGQFLEKPAVKMSATVQELTSERPGTVIGPYKLLQQIGEGGMGTVYMAEQTYPVQRKVALKLIKPGMDSRQVIARFEAERQALALMDHPNIAKVLDAGTTAGIGDQESRIRRQAGDREQGAKGTEPGSSLAPDPWPLTPVVVGLTSSWSWSRGCRSPSSAPPGRPARGAPGPPWS